MEQNAQLAILFCCGYLVSRLLVKAGTPERLVSAIFARRPSHARVVLYLVAGTALLSVLIPNAVTVITVLPVIGAIRARLIEAHPESAPRITTVLALAVIYGANIGGMGSITGTPANAVMAVFAAFAGVPDHGLLRFHRWLAWGIPLVVMMVLLSWAIICAGIGPALARERLRAGVEAPHRGTLEPVAVRACAVFLVLSFVLSATISVPGWERPALAGTATAAGVLALWLAFGRVGHERVLVLADCYRGLPLRGLAFVAVVALVAGGLAVTGVVERAAAEAGRWLPADLDSPLAFVEIALVTSFATELFSNTVIQLALLESVLVHAPDSPVLIELMLVVTLSCTCAFMSPLATGVNGLVFGELRGASLWRMLATGLVMNVAGAVLVATWVHAIVR